MVSTRRQRDSSVEPAAETATASQQQQPPARRATRSSASSAQPQDTPSKARQTAPKDNAAAPSGSQQNQPTGSGSELGSKSVARRRAAAASSTLPPVQEATSPAQEDEAPAPKQQGKQAAPKPAVPPSSTHAKQQAPAPRAAAPAVSSSDSEADSDDEDNILGGPLSELARSLKDAFAARVGKTDKAAVASTSQPAAVAKKDSKKDEEAEQLAALQWKHEVAAPDIKLSGNKHAVGVQATKEAGLNKKLMVPPRDPHLMAKEASKNAPDTAGKQWYDLPATKITEDVKLQLRLLRLRGAYDPKRFYKSIDDTKFPKYFQIGTVVDNATDFYGGRLTNKERGADLTQELLGDADIKYSRKRRYNKLQEASHKYQRVKKRKTDNDRINKKKHRPKH